MDTLIDSLHQEKVTIIYMAGSPKGVFVIRGRRL